MYRILNQKTVTKKEIMERILNDEDVLFSWRLLITGDIGTNELWNCGWQYKKIHVLENGWSSYYYKQTKQEVINKIQAFENIREESSWEITEYSYRHNHADS